MSIASEITRLQQAKADIKTAIENKGVTVPRSATLDDYADFVDSISGGGGGSVDWESIARGMCDRTTEFSITSDMTISCDINNFCYRAGLKSVDLSSHTGTSIGDGCFRNTGLTSIVIPSTITSIGIAAFNAASLETATISSSVTSIGSSCFLHCTKLEEVIMEGSTPPTLGNNAFNGNKSGRIIYVPDASVSAYQSATNWTTYASGIKGISERPTT